MSTRSLSPKQCERLDQTSRLQQVLLSDTTTKAKVDAMANFEDCVRFANQHMICSVATCDREQPRVRMLGMWFADTRGFYFSTVKTKKNISRAYSKSER